MGFGFRVKGGRGIAQTQIRYWSMAVCKTQNVKPFMIISMFTCLMFLLTTLVANLEWKSLKHLVYDSGYSHVDVIKSPADTRDYRFFVLPNGLQVLAVSDPTADRSAASMDVSVGHFSDPDELPGLAHFLEHMLFMGSQKYPDENQYSAFLSQHGGGSNAYTAAENTNYHFDITPAHFKEALDIFAQFFVSPLLKAESVEREVKAVENEHIKNLQSDGWRAQQLRKSMANPEHPYHKFGTGNLQTLCNSTYSGTMETHCHKTLIALRKFYAEHYSAPRMRLCVLGKETLAELEEAVRSSFSNVPEGGKSQPPDWTVPVRQQDLGARWITFVPITDQRELSLVWTLPPMYHLFRHKLGSYLSHLMGHEAAGSVASLLKKKGLIESLSAGTETSSKYGANFEVSVSLTQTGLDSVDEVLEHLFAYLRLLRATGPQQWVWSEKASLAQMHFRFVEKTEPSGYVVDLASNLQIYPPQYVLSAAYAYEKYDADLIEWLFKELDPNKVDVFLCAQKYKGKLPLREAVYGTEHNVEPVRAKTVALWSAGNIDPALHLVNPNPFIPKDFNLVTPGKKSGQFAPLKLVDKPGARLWYKQDIDFPGKNWQAKPKLALMFQIMTPAASKSAKAAMLSQLYTMLYTDSMTLTTYDAGAAGLSWSISATDDGISLTVGGYSDKLFLLLKQVTEPLVTCLWANTPCSWADPNRFETMKDELTRALENSKKSPPYTKATEGMGRLMKKRSYSVDRLLYELSLPTVDLDGLGEHVKEMFGQVHVEGFVHGNADEKLARDCLQAVLSSLGSAVLPDSGRELQQIAKLSNGFVFADAHTNPDDLNHAIELYYQWPDRGIKWDILGVLFAEMSSEPCFDQLRTKEQLGYLVACRNRPMSGTYPPVVNGFSVIIQSSFKEPHDLDFSARRFVDGFVRNMTMMDADKFKAHKAALLAQIQEKDKTVSEETMRLWGEISKRRYDWDRKARLEEALGKVTLKHVSDFAAGLTKLHSHSMAVWIYGKGSAPPDDIEMLKLDGQRTRIHSINSFTGQPPEYFPCAPPELLSPVVLSADKKSAA